MFLQTMSNGVLTDGFWLKSWFGLNAPLEIPLSPLSFLVALLILHNSISALWDLISSAKMCLKLTSFIGPSLLGFTEALLLPLLDLSTTVNLETSWDLWVSLIANSYTDWNLVGMLCSLLLLLLMDSYCWRLWLIDMLEESHSSMTTWSMSWEFSSKLFDIFLVTGWSLEFMSMFELSRALWDISEVTVIEGIEAIWFRVSSDSLYLFTKSFGVRFCSSTSSANESWEFVEIFRSKTIFFLIFCVVFAY